MTLRHLRVFVEVYRCMNMTQAAKVLYISQPAISKTISELENWYDAPLFERLNKNLYPTEAGRTVYEYASLIINMFDRMDAEAHRKIKEAVIHVGASVTVGTSLLSDIVTSFKDSYPEVKIFSVIENSHKIQEMIQEGKIDIAILEGAIVERNLVDEEFVGADLVVVCGQKHPLFSKPEITPHDYAGADFIVREKGSGTREHFEGIMQKLNIEWTPVWECSNTQAIKNAVAAGLGLGVLSRLSVRRRIQIGAFRDMPLFGAQVQERFSIIYHQDKIMNQTLLNFKKHCAEKFNEMRLNPKLQTNEPVV